MLLLDEHLLFLCYLQVTWRHACLLAVSDNLLGVGGGGQGEEAICSESLSCLEKDALERQVAYSGSEGPWAEAQCCG